MLRWDLTFTTGLSAKNLVIYLLATFLALRMVVGAHLGDGGGPDAGGVHRADRLRHHHLAGGRAGHQVPGL